jgi:glycosyltransferase involved in cell wall biosynthesis
MNHEVRGASRGRVLILVQNLPVPFDRRVWQEAQALTKAGYEVHVICPQSPDFSRPREVIDGIRIYRYAPGPEARGLAVYFVEYAIAIAAQVFLAGKIRLRHRIDVVHICNPPDLLFIPALPLIAAGARLIYDHHDACPELMAAKGYREAGIMMRIIKLLERLTYRLADVAIETNDSFREIALARGRMAPDDVFVVRSAPRTERFATATPDDAWRRGREHLVAYVGIMGRQDGLDYLIDAADLIVHQFKRDDIQFVLVGSGPELSRLRDRVRSAGLGEHVEFTGLISSDQVLGSILAAADVGVSPDEVNSMNDISTMNKVLEYMALSIPVAQFDLREGRVSAGEASLYARPNDAAALAQDIITLIDDKELRQLMGKIGNQRLVNMLSWERQVPQLLGAYERATSGMRRVRRLAHRAG